METEMKTFKRKISVLITITLLLLSGFIIISLPSEAQFKNGRATIYPSGRVEPGTWGRWTFTHYIGGKMGNLSGLTGLFSTASFSTTSTTDISSGLNGGGVRFAIPEGWSLPQITDPKGEGFITVTVQHQSGIILGIVTIDDRNITIPLISGSDDREKIYIVYGETAFGSQGAQAQNLSERGVKFTFWENPDLSNPLDWRIVAHSPKIDVVYPWEGIAGDINILTTQAIGVSGITFHGWDRNDDTGVAIIAEDKLSYTIGMQLNNADEYDTSGQHINIQFSSYAKTDMIVKLSTKISITNPDQANEVTDTIHIWYEGLAENFIGQIDPWNYLIKISGGSPGTVSIVMCINVGSTVMPGFYTFETFIEPTNWEEVNTANMG